MNETMTKYIGITGLKKSGKTTTIETITPILRKKGLKVGTVKIAFKDVSIDVNDEHYDVIRHRKSFPHKTLFKSKSETTYFVNEELTLRESLKEFSKGLDIVLLEGFKEDLNGFPQIALLKENKDIDKVISPFTVAITSIPEFSIIEKNSLYVNYENLVEIIIGKSLPLMPELNCDHCGLETCQRFFLEVIKDNKEISDCEILNQDGTNFVLKVNDKNVPTVDFIQGLIKDVITSMIKNLKLEDEKLRTAEVKLRFEE